MKVLTLMMVGLIVMEALATAVDQCSDSNIVRTQERPHNLTMTRVDQALEDETPFTVIRKFNILESIVFSITAA